MRVHRGDAFRVRYGDTSSEIFDEIVDDGIVWSVQVEMRFLWSEVETQRSNEE